MIFITQDIEQGKSLLYEAKILYEDRFEELVIEDDEFEKKDGKMILIIGADEEEDNFKIVRINNNATTLLKYSKEELLQRNLNKIMPNLFRDNMHGKIIGDWMNKEVNAK